MTARLTVRLIIDLVMTILILFALSYRVIGDASHEWIGVAVCAVCITHNILNRQWYKNIFKGAYHLRRGVMTAVNLLLVLAMAALIITGLFQSRTILAFLRLPGGMVLRQVHTTAAYWSLLLIGLHAGLHWGMIMNAFRKMMKMNGENWTRKITVRIAALAVAAFGVWASFDRDMFSKLFLGFSFDYWDPERPAVLFFAAMLSIMGVYVFIAYYALKLLERGKQK